MTDRKIKDRVDEYLRAAAAAGGDAVPQPQFALTTQEPEYITVNTERGKKVRKNGIEALKGAAAAAVTVVLSALIMAFTGFNLKVIGVAAALAFIVLLVVGLVLLAIGAALAWRERHAYASRKANE
jgi:hypothetical protein